MNISKNSWHYRTIKNMNRQPARSLCLYFWQVVFCSLFLYIIGPAILLLCAVCIVGLLPLVIGGIATHTPDGALWDWIVAVKCWSVGIGITIVFFAVGWFAVAFYNFTRGKISNYSVDKEPSVLVSYIQAKKQRVCPVINFKD